MIIVSTVTILSTSCDVVGFNYIALVEPKWPRLTSVHTAKLDLWTPLKSTCNPLSSLRELRAKVGVETCLPDAPAPPELGLKASLASFLVCLQEL